MAGQPSLWAACACGLLLLGCDDLEEFKTGPTRVFRGEVIGSDSMPDEPSFIRTGFASHTRMELDFDPYASSVAAGNEDDSAELGGRVNTYVCPNDRDCEVSQRKSGPFDRARLQSIGSLAHDVLAEYTFPGGGRQRNYIFGVRFRSALEGAAKDEAAAADEPTEVDRDAMLFISLMDSGKIELRALSPSVLISNDKQLRVQVPALFGVFVLERQAR